jgi:hypothetical protein
VVRRATTIMVSLAACMLVAPVWAQSTCPADGSPCFVSSEEDLRCAFMDPYVNDIVLQSTIELSDADAACDQDTHPDGSLRVFGEADGSYRSVRLRSETGRYALTATTDMDGTFLLCDTGGPADVELEDVDLEGAGLVQRVFDDGGNCGLTLDGVRVTDFVPGSAAAIQIGGQHMLQVHRSLFMDIDGTVLESGGGLLSVYQSAFVNCGRATPGPGDSEHLNGGAIRLDGVAEATVIGCLFWGNRAWTAGGALANQGSGAAWIYGSVFVGNQAPDGGAIAWSSPGSLLVFGSVFAGNAATSDIAVADLTVTGMPDSLCNFAWLDDPLNGGDGNGILDDHDLPVLPPTLDGRGGAVAVSNVANHVHLAKTVLLRNGAGRGGAIAVAGLDLVSDLSDPDPGGHGASPAVSVGLSHCTFADNEASSGAAAWSGSEDEAWLISASGLWLDHDGAAIEVEGPRQRVLLIHDTTTGPPLGEEIPADQLYTAGHMCGVKPDLHECAAGCEDAAQTEFCGAPGFGASGSWRIPSALHFGYELCPDETTDLCESTGEDACEQPDGPCAWQAGIGHETFVPEGDPPPTRGFTGLPCNNEDWAFADSDLDGTPDFAECDDPDAGDHPSQDFIRHPFAAEECNGLDDNCDGEVDEGVLTEWYLDNDGDGYGGGEPVLACGGGEGLTLQAGDCDDGDADTHPAGVEEHGDGVDNDCDGVVDADAPGCHSAGCLATRIAPGEDGVELSLVPWLLAGGGWSVLGWRRRRR